MKYIKLFMLLAAAPFLGACSDDDDSWNTAKDVTVSMENTTMRFKESAGIVNVPIKVEGETNGKVKVTVEVKETGSSPAKENVNYYITDKTINISDGEGHVELECVDDDEVNEDRTFEITIVSASGANIGNATTVVTLRDNDSEFYDKLQGSYTMTGVDEAGNAISWDVRVTGATEETDDDYNKTLYVTGMAGFSATQAILSFNYDKATNTGSVAFDHLGEYFFVTGLNFGMTNPINLWLVQVNGNNLSLDPVYGTWSADCKTITFDESCMLTGYLIDSVTNEQLGYIWMGNNTETGIKNIKMVKK